MSEQANTEPSSTRLRAEDPDDLITVLPYLIGYRCDESLVMAVFRDRVIQVCVRTDIVEDPAAVTRRFTEILRTNEADGVILVAYSADLARADRLLLPLIDGLAPVDIVDAIVTNGTRRWSRSCQDPNCCPPEGVPYDPASNRLAAEAVLHGLSRQDSRTDIAHMVQGPDASQIQALSCLTETLLAETHATPLARRRQLRDSITNRVRSGNTGSQTDADLIRLACLIQDEAVRAEAAAVMRREDAQSHADLWQQVVSRTVPALATPALEMLGLAAWICGQGTLQMCCAERARQLGTGASMIDLLDDINRRALPPTAWDTIRAELVDRWEPVA